ncbi:hypothetical protein AVEN_272622-1 [Araneus ventricosus]|uniref:Uncharacterized protein n=1 Tax=Araneus ventricosus TaxID=182803 RepID=A0A4Y2J439_ARAVE|nr:hypothetical protein AVEN_272622-1 [Araneus ventricosus]
MGSDLIPYYAGSVNMLYQSNIRNALHRNPNVMYKKLKAKPLPLSERHIDSSLNFVRKYLVAGSNWNDVTFLDEKKFNLDEPDGFKFDWYDLHKEHPLFSKRQFVI